MRTRQNEDRRHSVDEGGHHARSHDKECKTE